MTGYDGDLPPAPEPPRAGYVFGGHGRCRSCRAPIVWWTTPGGKRAPYDPDGTSHFATCPDAARFRRR